MFAGKPSVIDSFVDVRAAWSSWGRPAFCKALHWCLKGAWWEEEQRPQRCHCCLCPFAPLLTHPWAALQSCQWTAGMGCLLAWVPEANSRLLQTSLDCGRGGCEKLLLLFLWAIVHDTLALSCKVFVRLCVLRNYNWTWLYSEKNIPGKILELKVNYSKAQESSHLPDKRVLSFYFKSNLWLMWWSIIFKFSDDSCCGIGKKPLFTLLTMDLFRPSRLHLHGQQMSHGCGEGLLWEKFINDQWNSMEPETKTTCCYLTGVLGLPGNFRGERTFGSKENFSLTFSSTDGATYVKPWGMGWGQKQREIWVHLFKDHLSENNPQLMMSNETLSKPYHAMWWNSEWSFQENQQD